MSTHLTFTKKPRKASEVFAERVARNTNLQSRSELRNHQMYKAVAWDHTKKKKMFRVPGTNHKLYLIAGGKKTI